MNKGCKIVLGVLLVALILLGIGTALLMRYVNRVLTEDPGRVKSIANSIVSIQLPETFKESYGSSLMGIRQVRYTSGSGTNEIAVALIEISGKQARQPEAMTKLQNATVGGMDSQFTATETVQRMGTIRGQTVRFTRVDGRHETRGDIRMVSAIFSTRDGMAKFLLLAPVDRWDEQQFREIIQSIK